MVEDVTITDHAAEKIRALRKGKRETWAARQSCRGWMLGF